MDQWAVIVVTAAISTTSAMLVAIIGFWLALRQDRVRWVREKRSELYIDLLAEAYAEEQWMVYRLTAQEIREIADRDGTDPQAGEEAVKEHWERAADLPDTRLPAKDRALLGARAEAFATPEVRRRFNALGACYPPLIARGQALPSRSRRVSPSMR